MTGNYTVRRRVRASFSSEILQFGAVKGLRASIFLSDLGNTKTAEDVLARVRARSSTSEYSYKGVLTGPN